MHESEVKLAGISKAIQARGISLSQVLALIDPSNQFVVF